jgi:hypothetical protein
MMRGTYHYDEIAEAMVEGPASQHGGELEWNFGERVYGDNPLRVATDAALNVSEDYDKWHARMSAAAQRCAAARREAAKQEEPRARVMEPPVRYEMVERAWELHREIMRKLTSNP